MFAATAQSIRKHPKTILVSAGQLSRLLIKLAELSIDLFLLLHHMDLSTIFHNPMLQLIRTQCITWKFSKLTSIEVHCSAFAQNL
jgi:hypothetical protein